MTCNRIRAIPRNSLLGGQKTRRSEHPIRHHGRGGRSGTKGGNGVAVGEGDAVAAVDCKGRTDDAHRDGKHFVVRADEKLIAFVELEAANRARDELS